MFNGNQWHHYKVMAGDLCILQIMIFILPNNSNFFYQAKIIYIHQFFCLIILFFEQAENALPSLTSTGNHLSDIYY